MDNNQIIQVKYGTGKVKGLAEIVAICDAPMFKLIEANGAEYWWRQDLCGDAKAEDVIEYWQARAKSAEAKIRGNQSQ